MLSFRDMKLKVFFGFMTFLLGLIKVLRRNTFQDESGTISMNELNRAMAALMREECYEPRDAQELIYKVFGKMDADGDGEVTKKEFILAAAQDDKILKVSDIFYCTVVTIVVILRLSRPVATISKTRDFILFFSF